MTDPTLKPLTADKETLLDQIKRERLALPPLAPDELDDIERITTMGVTINGTDWMRVPYKFRDRILAACERDARPAPGREEVISQVYDVLTDPRLRGHYAEPARLVYDRVIAPLLRPAEGKTDSIHCGDGLYFIQEGLYDGRPAVFITPSKIPGEPNTSAARENAPNDRRVDGDTVLTFPTQEQAKRVADALCGAPPEAKATAKKDVIAAISRALNQAWIDIERQSLSEQIYAAIAPFLDGKRRG